MRIALRAKQVRRLYSLKTEYVNSAIGSVGYDEQAAAAGAAASPRRAEKPVRPCETHECPAKLRPREKTIRSNFSVISRPPLHTLRKSGKGRSFYVCAGGYPGKTDLAGSGRYFAVGGRWLRSGGAADGEGGAAGNRTSPGAVGCWGSSILRRGASGRPGPGYSQFDLYAVFIPEQVIYFYSGKPDIQCINGQLGDIVIVNAGSIYQITPIGIVTANRINFISGIFCHFCNSGKRFYFRNARFLLEI